MEFTGVQTWLKRHGTESACALFDQFGWMEGFVRKSDIAPKLFPTVKPGTAQKYPDATIRFLKEEGERTGAPQIYSQNGAITFTPEQIPEYTGF